MNSRRNGAYSAREGRVSKSDEAFDAPRPLAVSFIAHPSQRKYQPLETSLCAGFTHNIFEHQPTIFDG